MSKDDSIRKEVWEAAYNTWQTIANDWMEGHEGPLDASHLAEAIFDADRITTFNPDMSQEALEYIKNMEWPDDMVELCKDI